MITRHEKKGMRAHILFLSITGFTEVVFAYTAAMHPRAPDEHPPANATIEMICGSPELLQPMVSSAISLTLGSGVMFIVRVGFESEPVPVSVSPLLGMTTM